MIRPTRKIHLSTIIIALLLGLFLLFQSNTPVLADTVTALPFTLWGSTYYTLPFAACSGGSGGTVSTIPWTGTCCQPGSGGTMSTSGGYTIHTFYSSGTLSLPQAKTVDIMIVAGGVSTGDTTGGAAGQVLYYGSVAAAGGSYSMVVGGAYANSSAFGATAGTGAGAAGGAGGNGGSSRMGKPGADGFYNPIDGLYYGGGGGGGACCDGDAYWGGAGGNRGGGNGGGIGYWEDRGKWFGIAGSAATANTGGGGGAGGNGSDYGYGGAGAGGSGIIVLRYPSCT